MAQRVIVRAGPALVLLVALGGSAFGQGFGGAGFGFDFSGPRAEVPSLTSQALSADGRYVAFASDAANLVPGDTNDGQDVFVMDLRTGSVERVSLAADGGQVTGDCYSPAISGDGRYVAFVSRAEGVIPNDRNHRRDVFLRDRKAGTTERISIPLAGKVGDGSSGQPSISGGGRFVAFGSSASDLVAGDINDSSDVFVRDRRAAVTVLVSVAQGGGPSRGYSAGPAISADGRSVAFVSDGADLAAGDANSFSDVFVRDWQARSTELVSVSTKGEQASSPSFEPALSGDGQVVAFRSPARNLASGRKQDVWDVFVRDRRAATTVRASVTASGVPFEAESSEPALSPDGQFVAFASLSEPRLGRYSGGRCYAYLRDLQNETTLTPAGDGSRLGWGSDLGTPSIDAAGARILWGPRLLREQPLRPSEYRLWDRLRGTLTGLPATEHR